METYQISCKKASASNNNNYYIYPLTVTIGDYVENILGEYGYVTEIHIDGFSWYNLVKKCKYIFKEEKADMENGIVLNMHSFFKRIGICNFYQDSKNEFAFPTVDKLFIPYSDKLEHYAGFAVKTITAKINEIIKTLELHKLAIEDLYDTVEEID